MNITQFDIYLFGLLGSVKMLVFPAAMGFVAPGLLWVCLAATGSECDRENAGATRLLMALKRICITSAIALTILFFVPSQSTFAAMVLVPRIQQSEIIKRDFPALYEAARNHLLNSLTQKDSKHEE